MIRNLFFDLDDTLLDFRAAERNALSQALAAFGIPVTDALLERYAVINAGYWKRLERGEVTRDTLKVLRYRDLFAESGISGISPVDFTHIYEERLGDQPFLLPGAAELLARLHGSYRLFAASNGTGRIQRSRLTGAGISGFFDGLFLSEELGAEKPSPAFFDAAFARFPALLRSETVMIGDSLTSDIAGGIAAGLRTVWFNPCGLPLPPAPLPDAVARSLEEMEAAVGLVGERKRS